MRRVPHQNVATVLVHPRALADLELELMSSDFVLWPVSTAPICADGPRTAFQIRRSMLMRQRGAWDLAERWTPVWVGFGASWHRGDEPLPWSAHKTLWDLLERYPDAVRFQRRLGGIPKMRIPAEG